MQTFTFLTHPIRTVTIDGAPWFVVRDVLDVLGIVHLGAALNNVDQTHIIDIKITSGRGRPNKLINEPGLYKLILRSDKEEAKPFQKWVTEVVLPAIRKDGGTREEDLLHLSSRTPHGRIGST
ncbi:phage antirepressor protein [Haematobacter massiliensis]|uniref:Phage antirepressor protein n=1 Tax=Haematobacter massiliensis TaxID=195105 RepID=A0A086YAP1_9RHOB|nr:phage antirepressor protein [Haematobacter massiliensis]